MYTVEFETKINNGIVEVPARYSNISESGGNVRVIIVPIKKQSNSSFDPKQYFGVGKASKDEIDLYLDSTQKEWDNYINEK